MSGVLEGIRVIDFGQYIAGPLTAMRLADHGADVIRVDPPGGPRWKNRANAVLQRGKRSIVLDLKTPGDLDVAKSLIASADIVVENFRPGVMERLGVGPKAMLEANPRLVYCSIPGFASDDSRAGLPGWEGIVGAATGTYTGRTGGEPMFTAVPIASSFASIVATSSIVAALIARERCGKGQRIQVPLFDATFEAIGSNGQKLIGAPERPPTGPMTTGGVQYECKDGLWVHLQINTVPHFNEFAALFLPQEWAGEGLLDYKRLQAEPKLSAEFRRRMTDVFKTKTAEEWDEAVNASGAGALRVCRTAAYWLHEDEHARASRSVIELDDPEYGATVQAGYPISMSKTPPQASPRHPLDADRASVLADAAAGRVVSQATSGRGESIHQSLEGVVVIDTTQILAGPTAARELAEFGASVIKVNNPTYTPHGHVFVNSGKQSILIDLKKPEGMDVLWRLVEGADVFMQNFTRGTPERMGIGEDQVREHNANIVYSTVSAFGYNGPRGHQRGWEPLGQAPTGMQERTGGDEGPIMQRFAICDYGTGLFSAQAILLGLYHRLRTGEGQHVEASLSQTGTYHQAPMMIDYEGRVWDEPRGQKSRGVDAFYRLYGASDRFFFLADPRRDVSKLAAVEGLDGVDKCAAADLERELESRFVLAPAALWVGRLQKQGITAHFLAEVEEIMESAWSKEHNLSVVREHPGIGRIRLVGPAPRLSMTPLRVAIPAPIPGLDGPEVLATIGMKGRLDELVSKGAVVLPGVEEAVV